MAGTDLDRYRRLVTDEAVDALLDGIKDATINKHRDEAYLRDGVAGALRSLHQAGVIELADAGAGQASPTPTTPHVTCPNCCNSAVTSTINKVGNRWVHDCPACYRVWTAPIDNATAGMNGDALAREVWPEGAVDDA